MALKYAIICENINSKEVDLLYADGDHQSCMDKLKELIEPQQITEESARKGFVKGGVVYKLVDIE